MEVHLAVHNGVEDKKAPSRTRRVLDDLAQWYAVSTSQGLCSAAPRLVPRKPTAATVRTTPSRFRQSHSTVPTDIGRPPVTCIDVAVDATSTRMKPAA